MDFNNKGFTIVELLVGASIFLALLGGGVGALSYSLKLQRMILAHQEVAAEMSYVVDYMSRALRMVKSEKDEGCLPQVGQTYEVSDDNHQVKFLNHLQEDTCQRFFLENGRIMYEDQLGDVMAMTSPYITVGKLHFEVMGELSSDDDQPRVTVSLEADSESLRTPMKIQTTVSSRKLDVIE